LWWYLYILLCWCAGVFFLIRGVVSTSVLVSYRYYRSSLLCCGVSRLTGGVMRSVSLRSPSY
jgi:hypothetical protein